MRSKQRCVKCNSTHLLYIKEVADRVGEMGEGLGHGRETGALPDRSKPWRIARLPTPEEQRSWLASNDATAGTVEAFICRGCGYTELYTRAPETIPIDGEYIVEINGPEPDGPFR